MRIALAPDLHCFYGGRYDVIDKTGQSIRRKEWQKIASKMLTICKEQKVETLIVPGDFFVNPKPTAEQVLMVATLFRAFKRADITVLAITGNHDVSGYGATCMNEVVATIGSDPNWCISEFKTKIVGYDGAEIGFAFLPFVKNIKSTDDFASKSMSEKLMHKAEEMLAELKEQGLEKNILVGHWSIQGAKMSTGKTMEATLNGSEVVLPLGELIKQGWDACLFGHIHVPQVLSGDKEGEPFIAYSGCFQRINVGEANDERGFYIYDTDDGKYKFFKLPAIPMRVFNKAIETEKDFNELLAEIKEKSLKNKYTYVKYTIDKDKLSLVDKKAIEVALKEQNPLAIVGIIPKIVCSDRQRDVSVTESIEGETALEKWLSHKQIDKDKIDKVVHAYKELTATMD